MVVISGSPGMGERFNNPLLHHQVRDFRTQLEVFEKLCVAGDRAERPADRPSARSTACWTRSMRYKRPVYLELPRDMVNVVPQSPHQYQAVEPASDPDALAEAVDEAVAAGSSRPSGR